MCAFLASRRNGRWANARRGFSLVETLVVLAIIGTLFALVLIVCLKAVGETTHTIRYVSQQTMDLAAISDTPLHIPAPGAPPRGPDKLIPDQYIIEFDGTIANPQDAADKLLAAFGGGRLIHIYDTPESKGCNVFIPGTGLPALQAHPGVKAPLFGPERGDGRHAGGAPRRQPAGGQGRGEQEKRDGREGERVGGADAEEQAAHRPGQGERGQQPQRGSEERQPHPLSDHHAEDVGLERAQ